MSAQTDWRRLHGNAFEGTRSLVTDIRERAARMGRAPSDILVFSGRALVVGRTRKEAEAK